ncbi:MAG: HlyD family efflux transporter periplasmic adaptor subunit [Bacillota bacterium]
MKIISNNNNRTIYNREAGIISLNYDNLENEFDLNDFSNLSVDKFSNIKNNYKKIEENDFIKKGEPLYRLINNRRMLLVFKINSDNIDSYWINETVFVNKDNSSELLEAKVIDIIKEEKNSLLVIELNRFIRDFINIRKKEFHFVKNIYKGLILPATAVFPTSDGYKVVVVEENNSRKLKDVEIIFKDEKHMIVEGLEIGDEVVKDPAKENFNIGGSKNE